MFRSSRILISTVKSIHNTTTPFYLPIKSLKLGSAHSASSSAMSANVKQLVDEAIAGHKVTVFSKSYCPVSLFLCETHTEPSPPVIPWRSYHSCLSQAEPACFHVSDAVAYKSCHQYCKKAKDLLIPETDDIKIFELDNMDEGCKS